MNASGFVVVRIGCLECGHQSDLLGVYPTLDAAREAHPSATAREDVTQPTSESDMDVIFDLSKTGVPDD